MKAVVVTDYGSAEVMKYTDIETPSITSTQVLIRVVATSVNFADIKARYGRKGGGQAPPFIPGLEAAGVVEAVGADVVHLRVGQRVIAFPKGGSYAEYAVAEEALTFVIPDNLDMEVAAVASIVSFTSYKLLWDVARLAPGETVLIHAAAGGIGTTASQLARRLGASSVIGTVGSEAKVQTALESGCNHVICYESENFAERVNAITGGRGVDVILDSISGSVSERSLECLAKFGRLIHFGNSSGQVGNFKTKDLHASCRSVLGFSFSTTRNERPHLLRDTANCIFNYLVNNELKIKVGARCSLAEAAVAHDRMEQRSTVGKTLLTVSAE